MSGPGLEDLKEELIHTDFVGQTKLWVMVLEGDVCIEEAKLCLRVVAVLCFTVQHLFSFLCFCLGKPPSPTGYCVGGAVKYGSCITLDFHQNRSWVKDLSEGVYLGGDFRKHK